MAVPKHIVGLNQTAAIRHATQALERLADVQGPVVVTQFVARLDIENRNLELVAGAKAICLATVIDVASVVPAQDGGAATVCVAVAIQMRLVGSWQGVDACWCEHAIELISNPDYSPGWDRLRSNNTVANLFADKLQASMRMNHVCLALSWESGCNLVCSLYPQA